MHGGAQYSICVQCYAYELELVIVSVRLQSVSLTIPLSPFYRPPDSPPAELDEFQVFTALCTRPMSTQCYCLVLFFWESLMLISLILLIFWFSKLLAFTNSLAFTQVVSEATVTH